MFDSISVGTTHKEELAKHGVIFCSFSEAVQEHPELVRRWLGTVVPQSDNYFAALNSAVWSGGSFIYVPKGVKVEFPLQAYFRINAENMGQFERTLIIVDEGAEVHYVEGCTAPMYSTESLHSAVVEIIVKRGGRCRYTTIFRIEQKYGESRWLGQLRLEVRAYHDARMLEVGMFQSHRRVAARYEYPNAKMFSQDEKYQQNCFLADWLEHCLHNGRVADNVSAAMGN